MMIKFLSETIAHPEQRQMYNSSSTGRYVESFTVPGTNGEYHNNFRIQFVIAPAFMHIQWEGKLNGPFIN